MALVLADRVRETSVTTGTGTLTLAGAVTGYQTFSSAIGNTNTCYYTIANPGTSEWEVGIGTVGAGTLARTTILSSSNAGSAVPFSAGAKDVFVTYPAEKAVYQDDTGAYIPASPVFNGNAVISDNSANAALRITQTGAGNALLVEDSANPDATPFVVANNGYVIAGTTSVPSWWYVSSQVPIVHSPTTGSTGGYSSVGLNAGGTFLFGRSDGTDYTTRGIVSSGDVLGTISWAGDDGVSPGMAIAARISASVDGTPGATDMPGRLAFWTTPDGASLPLERMRINSSGNVGIGTASGLTTSKVRIFSDITDLTATYNIGYADGTHTLTANNTLSFNAVGGLANLDQNGFNATTTLTSGGSLKGLNGRAYVTGTSGTVTSAVGSYSDVRNTGAGTLNNAVGFQAVISNTGGGTLTNAIGVYINALTAGTNNYGVHSNIAAGTGRWNFYAPGSANNYFAGSVGIGTTALASMNLRVSGDLTGSTGTQAIRADGVVQSDSTSSAIGVYTLVGTAAAAFTVGNLYQYRAEQGTFGAGSTVTNQYGYLAGTTLTGATNNYGFYGNIAAGTNRYNFYANGTADNYFAGALSLGASPSAVTGSIPVNLNYSLTGATTVTNIRAIPSILSDVTSNAIVFRSNPFTQAAAFTLGGLIHYDAAQGTIGAGSAVVNQYGFNAAASLIGATNNYGFFSSIPSGTGRWNFYANGTANNYFAGNVGIGTTTPAQALQVSNSAGDAVALASGGTGASGYLAVNGNARSSLTGATTLISYSTGVAELTNRSNQYFAFGTNSTEYARIGSTGIISLAGTPGSESLRVTPVASAVNYLNAYGAATGNQVNLRVEGSDTNIGFNMTTKGTGSHDFYTSNYGGLQFRITNTASAVNYVQVSGGATGSGVSLSANGTDTNVGIGYISKGAGFHFFYSSSAPQFAIANTASAVNYFEVNGGPTGGGSPYLSARGTDANIHSQYLSKGTYGHIFNTGSAGNFQFYVAHTGSAVNYVQVTGGATGSATTLSAQGSDTNIGITLTPKGTGGVGISGATTTGEMFALRNTAETTATVFGLRNVSNINQATTTTVYGISDQTQILSPAALTNLFRFRAAAGSFTGTVTNQYGYAADSTLTGATNNYGFHSNIASGTGRWNFYAAGTATNYFEGNVGIGITNPGTWGKFAVGGSASGSQIVAAIVNSAGTANTQAVLSFDTTNNGFNVRDSQIRATNNGANQTTLEFFTASAATPTKKMEIAHTGVISLGAAPGSESLRVTPVASAVNYWEAQGAVTSGVPLLKATGSDANISLGFNAKALGVMIFGNAVGTAFRIRNDLTGANFIDVFGNSTGNSPFLRAEGTDTNVGLSLISKGTGSVSFLTNAGAQSQLVVAHTASAVNYAQVTGGTTGNAVTLSAAGSDTNIGITLTPKGTGVVRDANGNIRAVPKSGATKTASYTLATTDIGEFIEVGTGGSITIPDATFATGDIVSVFNNTTGNITITCTITTAYIGGTDSDRATVTLATRGVATILFISGTVCVINGNVV
jgi:hypothetical protein